MTYSDKLKDPRWQRKRLEILERDNFTCRDCHATNKPLHVHHCHYNGKDPWDTNNCLLLTLCEDCHSGKGELNRADLEKQGKIALSVIMANLQFRGDEDCRLGCFIAELMNAAEAMVNEGRFKPIVINEYKLWLYALNHPEFRQTYEEIADVTWNWEGIDKDRKERTTNANPDEQTTSPKSPNTITNSH